MKTYQTISLGQTIEGVTVTFQNKSQLSNLLKNVVDMKETFVIGKMGRHGVKTHAFKVSVFSYNGVDYLAGGYDLCGSSQSMGTSMTDDVEKVTCKKCLKSICK